MVRPRALIVETNYAPDKLLVRNAEEAWVNFCISWILMVRRSEAIIQKITRLLGVEEKQLLFSVIKRAQRKIKVIEKLV